MASARHETERRRWGLRSRTLAAMALIGLAIPAGAGVWTIIHVRDALQRRVEDGELAAARAVSSEVRQAFGFGTAFAKALAHRPGLVIWTRTREAAQLTRVLDNAYSTTPLFRGIAAFDLRGRLVAAFPPAAAIENPGPDARATVLPAEPVEDGDARLRIREPISDPNGPVVGLLVADLSFRKTATGVAGLRFGRTGSATLVDGVGRVLVTGERKRSGKQITSPELRSLLEGGRAGVARYFSPLVERDEIAALVPVIDYGWALFVTQAASEALAPVRSLSNALLVGLFVLLAVAGLIAGRVSASSGRYEQRLQEAAERLEASNRTIRDFVSTASHELRSPLSIVTGFTELLSERWDEFPDEQRRKHLDTINRQGRRLTRLVEDLLTLSRIDAGALDVQRKTLDARGAVALAVRELPSEVEVAVRGPALSVLADPDHLHRILTNYLSNALKYGAPPVEAEVVEKDGAVEIIVRDHGSGMPAELAPKLFGRFVRAATAGGSGTGLGLSIVRGLAEANGGAAYYEPVEPRGSAFVVRLERADPTVPGE